jgi:hypothetical protein
VLDDAILVNVNAAEAMARLIDQRARASARVEEIEHEARASATAAAEASAALAEFERRGGRPATERRQLEQALAEAKAKAAEPWAERAEGARQAVRDADQELQAFQGEHLSELVEALEADGRIATGKLNAAAEARVAAFSERERIAHEISLLASQVGRVFPGDVSFTCAEALVREARTLVAEGGEAPPELRRDPRQPRHAIEQPAA